MTSMLTAQQRSYKIQPTSTQTEHEKRNVIGYIGYTYMYIPHIFIFNNIPRRY